ncbi:MAG: hypothetical protein JSU63_03095 [Phycisphaerales bacterium]|nr:MAG: hypothetical protein JSU63_03095 [Phycisphaerales bacterium]
MAKRTFATAINCMDGRVQEPVLRWMKQQLEVDHVDMITEPGPDKMMTAGPLETLESIKRRVTISVNAHGSRVVAIFAHADCAGFPASKEEHLIALCKCVDVVKSWMFPVRVLGLWIDADWQVEQVFDSKA